MSARQWYRIAIQAKADGAPGDAADIYVYDEIGTSYWNDNAVSAQRFSDEIKALPASVKTLNLHVNSPGGSVVEAIAIANMLRTQRESGRTVAVHIDGLAASAATIITCAGSTIRMADNALMMVHNPYGIVMGTAAEMRKTAEMLDRSRDVIIATYQWASKLSVEELGALMDAETWMTADEALANGFVTEVTTGVQAAASFRPEILGRLRVPEELKARVEALVVKPTPAPEPPKPAAATDVVRLCSEGGLDLQFAQALIAEAPTAEAVPARITAEKTKRTQAQARATEIGAVCAKANQQDLAAGYIAGAMTVDQVKDHLTKITAKLDKVEVDASLKPDNGVRQKPVLNVTEIYRELNQSARK